MTFSPEGGRVYIVGAGPGDPDLLTVKGERLLREAGTLVYAGSLVNPELLSLAGPGCRLHDSAAMDLDEIVAVLAGAAGRGEVVVRLHSGDPSLYGAIAEQVRRLDREGVPWEVVPGVSSFLAAAAAGGTEYTLPGVSQTLIITRRAGRTGVPAREELPALASHRASLCLFLSSHMLKEATAELMVGYPPDTPARLVYRASWPDQVILDGTLSDIAARAEAAGIDRTALLLVGDFLRGEGEESRLYSRRFGHGYRGKKT